MLSIVVPLLNESESLPQLLEEIMAVKQQKHIDLEIIFVDDGSTDGSWISLISSLRNTHLFRASDFAETSGKHLLSPPA